MPTNVTPYAVLLEENKKLHGMVTFLSHHFDKLEAALRRLTDGDSAIFDDWKFAREVLSAIDAERNK